jgi:hypothetical protein
MTKLANKPPYCASCFQQEAVRYVDFEAAYDGPVIPGSPANIPIDDLVICEKCLGTAFNLLDPQSKDETIAELVEMVEQQQDEIAAKDKAIQGSRATINELVDHPVAMFPGKPRLEGLDPEVRARITKARYERRGTSPASKKPQKVAA